jgi:ketosteroid isomerase-like protein
MLNPAALFLLALATPTVSADSAPAVEAEIKQLELTLAGYLSRGEIDAYAPNLAEDYVLVSDDGSVLSKAEVLAEFRRANGPRVLLEPTKLKVRVYGDTAVLTGDLRFGSGHGRFTKVFIRRAGRWYLVNTQGTPLKEQPAPRPGP